jgi:tetratricopeptide (TPR) repeat protein
MALFKSDPQAAEKKALAEQLQLLEKTPQDVRILMKAADLHHRLGQLKDAGPLYARAARRYAEEGFFLKAVGVNKVAISLRPEDPFLLEEEAALYNQLDLGLDAFESMKKAIALHEKSGNKEGEAAARRRLVEIDPDNLAGRVAIAEELVTRGSLGPALDQLDKVAGELSVLKRTIDLDRVKGRIDFLREQLPKGA